MPSHSSRSHICLCKFSLTRLSSIQRSSWGVIRRNGLNGHATRRQLLSVARSTLLDQNIIDKSNGVAFKMHT
ncbi:hypothetical protein BCR33DRAFT_419074 [Rhizoclosmatium globosum]|uniref:Uncharacterized protein n=1 Tax=Rhizoclosmatium globosum TaxID=329046 RepID=A0A1Y2BWN8_9FUNG|nr:hypothetical protein BCR33DRAFT_419074 [Rhizoclosmatium globosum]|eukprot:ORY39163.1 hypothetical protein BCR33DRAFT_419074 [Rhizoclosmatium globosum]